MQKDVYELTNPQKSIWDLEQYYKGTSINNICGQVIIRERVDFDKLQESFHLFFQFYDNLSLRFFVDSDGMPKQYFSSYNENNQPFEIVDLKSVEDLNSLANTISTTPFNVIENKLYNIVLFRFPDNTGGFFTCAHHLVFDAWTANLMASKIIELYSQLKNGEQIKNVSYSYSTFIAEEANYNNSNAYIKDKTYWLDLYKSIPEAAFIPSINHTAISRDFVSTAERNTYCLSAKQTKLIKDYCKKLSISPYNLFMGALSIYINGVTNLENFVIGTPILNRLNHIAKQTPGMYISTLPLNINVNSKVSFKEFISSLCKNTLTALRHQRFSYQKLLEELRKENKQIPNLYKILLSYQISKTTTSDTNHEDSWIFNSSCPDEMQIHIQDYDYMDNLNILYDYRTTLYSREEIDNIHNRLLDIISQVIANEDILIRDISIVTSKEKNIILNKYNNEIFKYDTNLTYIDFFKKQVEKTPNETALIFENKKLTFKELDEMSNKIANYLVSSNIPKASIVGICLSRSFDILIAIIGILKAGCAYLPIDLNYPAERINYIVHDSGCKMLLINESISIEKGIKFEFINKILSSQTSSKAIKLKIDKYSPSYVIYTSGSTGKPKGVMLNHIALTNLTNYCNETIDYLKDGKHHTIISMTTISFDIFIFETLISLQRGLTVVIANTNEQLMPKLLNNLLLAHNIEAIQLTPSRMEILLKNINDIPSLGQLKYITLAGEPFTPSIQKKLLEINPQVKLYNGYGPSETTVFATLSDITKEDPITIGRPIFNNDIYVFNNNKQLLPIGYTGELYISGDNVGIGYINRKELTASLFTSNPFYKDKKMYKSGDLGHYLPDGRIICEGRVDNQVKIRGQRIELSEIENTISKIDGISKCIVLKRVVNDHDEVLCAYYIATTSCDINTIRSELMKSLPMYMVPQYFVKLDEIPYTPNGKVDKKELEKIDIVNTNVKNTALVINPSDEIETKLVKLVKHLVNAKDISMNNSFIELGGDSLSAITLSIEINNTFDIDIPVKSIIDSSSLLELALLIKKSNRALKYTISKAPKQESYPLSTAQSRIYYATRSISNNNLVYNTPGAILFNCILDSKKVEKAFKKIIEANSSFRTQFIISDAEVRQEIVDKVDFKVDVSDNTEQNIKYIVDNYAKPFDLSKAPIMRASICYIDKKQTLLLFDSHHIVLDGTSIEILLNDFVKLYNNQDVETPELEYVDYSVWENTFINSDYIKDAENYWINKLSSHEQISLALPYDYSSSNKYVGEKVTKKLRTALTNKITKYCSSLGISPYMFYISAFFILLYKYSGQKDIIVGTPSINRPDNKLYNLIGMFVNDLSVRATIDSNQLFSDFVSSMKDQILSDIEYSSYPYDLLLKKLDITNNHLFDVMFTYQNTKRKDYSDVMEYKLITASTNIAKFNLSFEIDPYSNNVSIEYSTDLFKRSTIEKMYTNYINIINSIIAHPNSLIRDLRMISSTEEKKIAYSFNNKHLAFPTDMTLVDLFKVQVDKHGNDVAIEYKDMTLTYKELDEKSNFIAKQIIDANIPKGSIIGACLNRSPELICCIWGILKANCAYMPLSVDYPVERINYILGNSNTELIFTNTKLNDLYHFENKTIIYDDVTDIRNIDEYPIKSTASPEDLAYVIYTSGSTGTPKGVKIAHINLMSFIYNFNNYYKQLTNKDSLLASTNISFDVSIWEFFLPILSGARLVLYEENIVRDIIKYTNDIVKYKITTLYIAPNILNEVYDFLQYHKKEHKEEIYISKLLVGVEPIKKTTLNKYYNLNPKMIIVNGYGPTETTICCTALPYTKDTTSDDYVSIGYPLYNNNIYILNDDKQIQPIGVPGELYVSGKGVGLGYLNNPIETEKHFLPNTFDNSSNYIYKTGDLAKWLNNGEIRFLGRNDSQVKISGHRIELNEISAAIMTYDNISKAYSMIVSQNSKKYIVSYFEASRKININKLNKYLKEKLVDYMIPAFIMQLDKFPLTANGKIDVSNLPTSFEISTSKYVPPRNDLEKEISEIWKNLLSRKEVGIDDNFFEIGGDSLSAIKFEIEALNSGLKISYADIFSHPTIRELSEKSNEQENDSTITKSDDSDEEETFDYESLNKIIANNKISNIGEKIVFTEDSQNGVLLLGATGFLGAHILNEFLSTNSGNIYCLVRKKGQVHPEERLKSTLNYYFGSKYNNLFGKRIFVVQGDITESDLGLNKNAKELLRNGITQVIDSAALVKHYGNYDTFKKININGTKEVIKYCKKYKKELFYISTLSVSGNDDFDGRKRQFKENNFYINQNLNNVYTSTKFEAERLIIEEMQNGFKAHILRLGNITNRYSDGKFQINYNDNAFINKLKGIISLGKIPKNILPHQLEFSPVDYCAKAIIKIVNSNTNFTVFHIFNSKTISCEDVLKILSKANIEVEPTTLPTFNKTLKNFLTNDSLKESISGLVTDIDSSNKINLIIKMIPNADFTNKFLKACGFEWPAINEEYMIKFINYFKELNLF